MSVAIKMTTTMKHHSIILALTFILTVLTNSVNAQQTSYTGFVIDKDDNTGLAFASLKLIKTPDTIITRTNVGGEFEIKPIPIGEYKLQINYLGYHSFDSAITITNNSPKINFKLSVDSTYKFTDNFGYSKENALADIKNNKMTLIIPGGFISKQIYPKDTIFENKYMIKYRSLGCIVYDVKDYNLTIGNYLDKKFGTGWRKEVRDDVIGLK
jgi:hypothetical protein